MRKLHFDTLTRLAVVCLLFTGAACSKRARAARHTDRGDRYFEQKDYAKAKIEYMNVLRASGPDSKAIERLGEIWYEQGDYIKAAPFLAREREVNPGNTENRLRLARVLSALNQRDDARKEAAAVLEQAPSNGEALLVLTESSISPEDIANAQQVINDFPEKNSGYYSLALANLALRQNDLAAAEKFARAAAAADPKLPAAHVALGLVYSLKKDQTHAREELKAAADLAPLRSLLRISYAEFLAQTGSVDEATRYLTDLANQTKDYLPVWNALARLARNAKKYDDAERYIKDALALDADNPDMLMLQAQILLSKGNTKEGIAQLERLDQKFPNVPALKFQLARAYLQENKLGQAATALEEAVAVAPTFTDAVLLLAELNIRTGKAQATIAPLDNLRKTQPNVHQASRLLADAYRALGRLDDAANVFREEIQAVPNWAEPYYFLGIVLREQKKNSDARAAFTKASEIEPNNPGPIEQLVEIDIAENRFDAATQRVQNSLLDKNPQSAPAHFLLAKILVAQKKWDQAEAELQKTLELDPNLEVAYRLMIATYVSSGKLPEAAARLEDAVAKNPKNGPALFTLANVYSALKDYPKAQAAYEKVLALQPNSALALNNLAYLYAERLNDLDKALEFANRARSIAPGDPHVADTLGWVLYKRGDYQQAATVLRDAATALRDSAEAQFHYGMASYMMGAADEARAALQKAVESNEDFPGKDEARNRLSLLSSGASSGSELSVPQLQELVKANPTDVVALVQLGQALEKTGAAAEAAATFEKATQLNPKLLAPPLKLAQLYAGPLKDKAKALEYAKKARDLAPNDPDAAAVLGGVAFDAGNYQWAYGVLNAAARRNANDANLLHRFSWAAYSIGKVAEAEQAMQKAAAASHDPAITSDATRFLALLRFARPGQDPSAGDAEARQALGEHPDYVPALMIQAGIQARQHNSTSAIATYSEVLHRFPDFAPAQKQLAALYADDPAKQDRAYELASAARKTLPDDPELAETLGRLSYVRKDYRRAIQLFQEAQKKRPLSVEGLYCLGMSQLRVKDNDGARQNLEKALSSGLAGGPADEANRALADIKR